MALSPRYALDTTAVLAGGFLVVSAMTFSNATAGWLSFAVSTAVTVVAGAAAVLARSDSRRLGNSALSLIGLWSLVAALVFSGATLHWLVLADALLLALVALADLTAHELSTERVVHELEIRPAGATETTAVLPAAKAA
ncbi:hypothetical protein OG552_33000 [Streptomyces sp. NBC_01476]|uniref:hypothetical protein n=1 Tax=Streptomyces sp. NBC_01476 TaxID=2903881 RepID=UPI002E30047E|nr:hypothetical protein [Streptomyces sp. NBC_01476]